MDSYKQHISKRIALMMIIDLKRYINKNNLENHKKYYTKQLEELKNDILKNGMD